jgi:ubiquinone/menaquinone biosynthesis C-methylase UbiE
MQRVEEIEDSNPVVEAFSRQSMHYDEEDLQNPILQKMRQQVYRHVSRFIKKPSRILELNSGTGIDALHFVRQGHYVHATDLSQGMIDQISNKVENHHLQDQLTFQRLSFAKLDQLKGQKFDFIFSNFGGLNCTKDLSMITRNFREILNSGGYVTLVIMPPVSVWEILGLLKGNKNAFRRLSSKGTVAHLEGKCFKVWYHSLYSIKTAFGPNFKLIQSEGLAALLPPPHAANFSAKYPRFYQFLNKTDELVREKLPFNRWADHIIVSFQLVC